MVHQPISGIEEVEVFRGIHGAMAPSMIEINGIFIAVFLFLTGGSTQWAVWFCGWRVR